eukprot:6083057-Pyramimonas_sp.AAC.1
MARVGPHLVFGVDQNAVANGVPALLDLVLPACPACGELADLSAWASPLVGTLVEPRCVAKIFNSVSAVELDLVEVDELRCLPKTSAGIQTYTP